MLIINGVTVHGTEKLTFVVTKNALIMLQVQISPAWSSDIDQHMTLKIQIMSGGTDKYMYMALSMTKR